MKSLSLNQPHAIVMVGIPGSGKSQFAERFSDMFHAPYLSSNLLGSDASDSTIDEPTLSRLLSEFAKTGASIVVEADTATRTSRSELSKLLKSHEYNVLFVWVQTDPETAKYRSLKSKRHTTDSFEQATKRFSQPHPSEQAVVISGKHTYASQAKIILKRLSGPREEATSELSAPTPRARGNIIVR